MHTCILLTFQDECSFVSLRDVERAMIVFEYFYERMEIFAPLMEERAEKERRENVVEVDGQEVIHTVLCLKIQFKISDRILKILEDTIELISNLFSIYSTGCCSTTDTTSF